MMMNNHNFAHYVLHNKLCTPEHSTEFCLLHYFSDLSSISLKTSPYARAAAAEGYTMIRDRNTIT